MNDIPSEILHKIFINVPFKQRLECALVCGHWYSLLDTRSLLYDIHLVNEKLFNQFMTMLQWIPSRASQVEILRLPFLHTFDKRALSNLFPNLRILQETEHKVTRTETNYRSRPFRLCHSNSKLESIREDGECEFTRHLLTFASCSRLKNLNLKLRLIANPRKEIFDHLKSATHLTKLTIRFCKIGIDEMEIIHNNVQTLESIQFKKATLNSGEFPRDIVPATSVKYFRILIKNVDHLDVYSDWCKYLAMKYTNLKGFNDTKNIMLKLDWGRKMKTYQDGIFPIYRTTGLPLPFFQVKEIPKELTPFHMMDEFGVGASKVVIEGNNNNPLFEQLAVSNVSKYVKVLTIDTTVISSPVMIQNFTALTSISIEMGGLAKFNVSLNDYFKSFPASLTHFHGKFLDARIDTLPTHPNNILDLFIECDTMYPKLCEAVSRCFPKLNNLSLYGGIRENIVIDLPTQQFKDLKIGCPSEKMLTYGAIIKKTGRRKLKYYLVEPESKKFVPVTAEKLEGENIISIHYSYADRFVLNGLLYHL